jgi:fructose PTS system EIIB component
MMKLVLARIDDRFIHGQVTVGWGQRLRPDLIILASDEIAGDPWQARVYCSTVPPQMQVAVVDLARAAAMLSENAEPDEQRRRAILLAGNPSDMHALISLGAPVGRVNVGGMHFCTGKFKLLPSIYVDNRDLRGFRSLLRCGVPLVAQSVPGGREVMIDDALLAAVEGRW